MLTCKSIVILGERERKTNRTISQLCFSAVSLRIAGVQQLHQVKRMIGRSGNMPCSNCSQIESGYHPRVSFSEPLGHVITLRGQILVSRTGDDPLPSLRVQIQNASVCTFKMAPCVRAPRAHVFDLCAWCPYTRGHFECAHGGVLDGHTEGFHRATPHTPQPRPHRA